MFREITKDLAGVFCLHCGMNTPVHVSADRGPSEGGVTSISIIRCQSCGKEAPYLADEIVVFKGISIRAHFAA
jgi:hypothetical protein